MLLKDKAALRLHEGVQSRWKNSSMAKKLMACQMSKTNISHAGDGCEGE